ncbi:large-conductance mechanosensitive channel [Obelidium mucronatum]|nr:large-conductance mechanosensitive channel [Obelidium mucronatum]
MDALNNRLPPSFPPPAETDPLAHETTAQAPASIRSAKSQKAAANKIKRMTHSAVANVGQGLKRAGTATMGVGEAFAAFISRGSVVDLAVGVVMGAAFTAIVNSFVNDLITPIIGLIGQKNLGNLFLVMHCASNSTTCGTGSAHNYATIAAATGDGAATWNYGNFIQAVINFILISLVMFFFVQFYSNMFLKKKVDAAPTTKACDECAEECPLAAKRCRCCLTVFPIVEEAEIVALAAEPNRFSAMFHK